MADEKPTAEEHAKLPSSPSSGKANEMPQTTSDLLLLAERMRGAIDVKDRRYHLQTYKNCFLGSDAADWLQFGGYANSAEDAVTLGNLMMESGAFSHVLKDHKFKNEPLFYRFTSDESSHGRTAVDESGTTVSWAALGAALWPSSADGESSSSPGNGARQTTAGKGRRDDDLEMERAASSELKDIGVSPLDQYNVELLDNVHPAAWVDPAGDDVYNMLVLGAGSGGLVTAAGSAGVGARVALVESHLLGGDCLNVGCVPSKALIAAATVAHTVRTKASEYGIQIEGKVTVDFGAVMERMRRLRASISHHDSAERFSKDLGIDVFVGRGKFTGPFSLVVNGKTLRFKKAVIATGGTPAVPPIPGLRDAPYMTNTSIFNLTELPPRLIVIGGGPIGLELAQAFRRFGSEVTVLVRSHLLPKEDPDAAAVVRAQLEADGVKIVEQVKFMGVIHFPVAEGKTFPRILVTRSLGGGEEESFECDALLVATGRKPNVENLGLEVANVKFDTRSGVIVSDTLQTSNKNIYAVGDCCTAFQFTHVSDFMARLAIRNALFFGKGKFSSLLIPWATYTEPEIAHVGLYPRDMEEGKYTTFTKKFDEVDRAILEGETAGFVKIHVKANTDVILGATIVGPNAGDMISEISVAMQHGIGLGSIASTIHPYPTKAEIIRQTGDLYNKTRLTPFVKGLFRNLMKVQRR